MNGYELAKSICQMLLPGERSVERACEKLIWAGGVDTEKITLSMLMAGLMDEDSADWAELNWGASEVMTSFAVESELDRKPEMLCACAVGLIVLAHSVRRKGHYALEHWGALSALNAAKVGLDEFLIPLLRLVVDNFDPPGR